MNSLFPLLASAAESAATTSPASGNALWEAIRISIISMIAILAVMGFFGVMITVLGKAFPHVEEPE
jgi:hypothetical protein